MSRLTEGTTEEYAERKRRDRLTLLHLIQNIRPIGEPFNDALFDCATVLIGGEEEIWRMAAEEYRPMMQVMANAFSPGFTVEALQRRRDIGQTIPNMSPKSDPAKKSKSKRGGKV